MSSTVAKTIKLYIGGKFPRTESGRSFPLTVNGSTYAELCRSSRKDVRNAVTAAQSAQAGWASRTAYNRSQILYRMAEMYEARKPHIVQLLKDLQGMTDEQAQQACQQGQDAFVYYAGFADKYSQVMASVNPVSGPFHNFTTPEAVGTVGLLYDKDFNWVEFIAQICAVISSGNSVVAIWDAPGAGYLSELAEIFATSDLPGGVVNLLSGYMSELIEPMAGHMEVESILYAGENIEHLQILKDLATQNMKRVVPWTFTDLSLEPIVAFTEAKTIWHPVGV